jgi:hypothetical protein
MSNTNAVAAVTAALETTTHSLSASAITLMLTEVQFGQGSTVKAQIEDAAASIGDARFPEKDDASLFLTMVEAGL